MAITAAANEVPSPAKDETFLGDEEEDSADGSDSDFGLSDRQLCDIWSRFQESNEDMKGIEEETDDAREEDPQARATRMDGDDEVICDRKDSDFGLSDWQLYQLRVRAGRSEASGGGGASPSLGSRGPVTDPLRAFAREKASTQGSVGSMPSAPLGVAVPWVRRLSASSEMSASTSWGRRPSAEDLMEEQLPRRDPEVQQRLHSVPWRLEARLASSREIDRVTWYLFKVEENEETRFYMKRFSDFKHLDRALRVAARPGRIIPALPVSGRFGLRHLLDLGDFNRKRLDGLRLYVEDLLCQVGSLTNDPALMRFFGRGAPGRVLPPGPRSCVSTSFAE
mmetsp:Transcript_99154/g.318160  ORF Transcript_99154/g.318160 Transcript_99154/m.318160 type:complete len:337 (-) Transcript_99154:118-1128(-)